MLSKPWVQKELSPVEASLIIQISFRAYLVRHSQISFRAYLVRRSIIDHPDYFTDFSYRCRLPTVAAECQSFSEKILLPLLTVTAIDGAAYTVCEARSGMVDDLEPIVEVMAPQPPGKLGSMKRRNFALPENGPFAKEMAVAMAKVLEMLNQEESSGGSPRPFL